jgi:hypothetical protein
MVLLEAIFFLFPGHVFSFILLQVAYGFCAAVEESPS